MSVCAIRITNNEIILGADSIICYGASQVKDTRAKIFKVSEDFGISGVGYLREISLLFLFAKTHTPPSATNEGMIEFFDEFSDWFKKKTDKTINTDSVYFIVYKGKAFEFQDFAVQEITNHSAIGAGADFARTALYLNKSVEEAIDIACELSIYCEKPINIFTFKKE